MSTQQNEQQLEKNIETPEVESTDDTSVTVETETVAETTANPPTDGTIEEEVETGVSTSSQEESPEATITALTEQLEALQNKLQEQAQQYDLLKNSHIRLTAEFDNYRKRTAKEKQDLETQVKCRTIGELLSVVDNFERARNSINPSNDGEAIIHKSYQGVYKNLVDSLKRLGVSPMRPEGQPFDPLYHEAMLREYTDEYPEGTVIEELMRGYMLGDQVLRHAMVKVAAEKPTESPEETESSSPDETNSGE
ncbi:heat shock protein [Crocosphaera subtropica ATCC 51142]|uniref:Protein GrpE n=1 Tax=Crocosphaera subtropica (strain ATCC 51142 / BH68) TaxID=43989 RepID=B1WQQ1_CROS5|nr:nucleotide exchange factor GrpE [Crocosphaera subtropica]ACB53353.1 heat shock protein [Crocosphaera subtropica ATCC 51142]